MHHRFNGFTQPVPVKTTITVVGICVAILFAGCGAASQGVVAPTIPGTATPTTQASAPSPALLGGSLQSFSSQYGPPSTSGSVRVYTTLHQGTTVVFAIDLDADVVSGNDGQQHVIEFAMLASPVAEPDAWGNTAAQSLYAPMLPADSQVADGITDEYDGSELTGNIYFSSTLASELPVSVFGGDTPGTFRVLCGSSPEFQGVGLCVILIGHPSTVPSPPSSTF